MLIFKVLWCLSSLTNLYKPYNLIIFAILNFSTVILAPRVFGNPRTFDFDHIENSLLILFEILSLEGWTEVRDVLESINPPWGIIFIHLYVFLAGIISVQK